MELSIRKKINIRIFAENQIFEYSQNVNKQLQHTHVIGPKLLLINHERPD